MRLTLRPFISLILLGALAALAVPARAQSSGVSPTGAEAGKAQRFNWPRTFSGQPDFAFTREEAQNEARAAANRSGQPMPSPASLMDLFSDDTRFDPLGLLAVSSTMGDLSATVLGGGEGVSGTVSTQTLLQKMMNGTQDLPDVSTSTPPDVAEFRAGLVHTLSSTVARWQPGALLKGRKDVNFQGVLDTLTLQAVVTSPSRYAVINQQRYAEGDSFLVQVPLTVPDDVLLGAMNAQIPPSGTVPEATRVAYQGAYDSVMKAFYAARRRDASLGQKVLTVPVVVQSIQPRKVLLNVRGEVHELAIKFVY